MKVRRISRQIPSTTTPPSKDTATISVSGLEEDENLPNHPFLYMKFPKLTKVTKDTLLSWQSTSKQQSPLNAVNTSKPATTTITYNTLKKSIGFLKPNKLIRHFTSLLDGRVKISHIDKTHYTLIQAKQHLSNHQEWLIHHLPPAKPTAILYTMISALVQ